jgi:hypothetical protein
MSEAMEDPMDEQMGSSKEMHESMDEGMKKPIGDDMDKSMETPEPMKGDMDDSRRVGRWTTSRG